MSLTFSAGELSLIIGPSGSGKTTLLSILGCLLSPTSGEVRLLGREVSHLPESARVGIRTRSYRSFLRDWTKAAPICPPKLTVDAANPFTRSRTR